MKKSLLLLLALGRPAAAEVSDVEVPQIVFLDTDTSLGAGADDALDLANIVQSAAKGVTTVQEAPAIVTVVTADDIRDRQFHSLGDLYDTVPGWTRVGAEYSNFPIPVVRGQLQAVQFLQDGLSQFDPFMNIASTGRIVPMELIKRVEMITGPGGVLWGSNSLLGIMNLITKDAEDVEGVEVGGTLGDGNGDRKVARAYVMAGKSTFLHGQLKLFAHGSVETFQGGGYTNSLLLFHDPLPQPNSANTYGPLTMTDQAQSMLVNLSGKLTYGKLKIRVAAPFGDSHIPMGLSGNPVLNDRPEDAMCPPDTTDTACLDYKRASRLNQWNSFDRFVVGEYSDRFARGKAGITLRGYVQQFVRGYDPLQVLAPSPAILGGLSFKADMTSYRTGGNFDGDVDLGKKMRVLYGAEAFREFSGVDTTTSRQGEGTQSGFDAPYDLTVLPILCPRIYDPNASGGNGAIVPVSGCPLTFAYPATRTVMGAYVSPQIRPNKQLILDGGVRAQVAPENLGTIGYPVNFTAAGTVVWNFIPNWHAKVNYAQGFRPPVFNNTTSNGEGVQLGGDPNLKVETSDATQAEINARIFKGDRRIRELSFRVDGSYTRIKNFIQLNSGQYGNSADHGVSSVEFLGKLFVQGGHRIELGYTWLRIATADRGLNKVVPEHSFSIATVFNLVNKKLTGTTNLKVTGATEDANRIVEYRDSSYGPNNAVMGAVTNLPSDVVFDRLPPIAELSAGLTYTPSEKLLIRATVYNALFGHTYQPDVFGDYEPHLEYLPNPYEGFRAYLSAAYQY